MKNIKNLFYSVLFVFLLLQSCNNTESNTEIGLNTISFSLDSKQYSLPATSNVVFLNGRYTSLVVRSTDNSNLFLLSWVRTTTDRAITGEYAVGASSFSQNANGTMVSYLACNPQRNFTFTVKEHNTAAKTIKGVFSGTLCQNATSKAVTVNNGVFFVRY